ncbi:MAG: UDP-4-amino-4,6-dideoxy-N-acetyl-beta-L-altrosamine transaminase [Candidatus Omnitrophota bacterium]
MEKKEKFLPLSKPSIGQEEIDEVVDSLKSGWITTGPKVKKFEDAFREYVGSKHAVAVNSGTAALHLAYQAMGLKPGDEVITTSMTFVATINMLITLGVKPVFADIEGKSLNIDTSKIEEKISEKTKAIIPVHFAGRPVNMDRILEVAGKYKLKVIEDAAHAVGTEYKGKKIGSTADVSCFSFHPIKNITTGEGGMISTDDDEIAATARLLRFHGISKEAWARYSKEGLPFYEVVACGYKYNMMDIQAALGIHQLAKIEEFNYRRRALADLYDRDLMGIDELILPDIASDKIKHSWHLYVIALKTENLDIDRNQFVVELKKENIGCGIHFTATHLQPYYQSLGFERGSLPVTEYYSDRIISLPLFPAMSKADVKNVSSAVKRIVKAHKK